MYVLGLELAKFKLNFLPMLHRSNDVKKPADYFLDSIMKKIEGNVAYQFLQCSQNLVQRCAHNVVCH